MKYMLLIYQNPAAVEDLSEDEVQSLMRDVDVLMTELAESGEWVGGEALAPASKSKIVRVRDGAVAVTDGPFAEAKEQMVGYSIVDCATEERAIEIAPSTWARPVRDVGSCAIAG